MTAKVYNLDLKNTHLKTDHDVCTHLEQPVTVPALLCVPECPWERR